MFIFSVIMLFHKYFRVRLPVGLLVYDENRYKFLVPLKSEINLLRKQNENAKMLQIKINKLTRLLLPEVIFSSWTTALTGNV